jgi:hypothetical protein
VPDTRTNRGAHPQDRESFAPEALPALREALADLSWLLTRGYPKTASLKLVGDRFGLKRRQRIALQRCAASDEECAARRRKEVGAEELRGRDLFVDGYNVLLTLEVAMGGGVVLAARDGTFRDMASMSGHYRKVNQTRPALVAAGRFLEAAGCRRVTWLLDRPVSNSARLRAVMQEIAEERGWPWSVELSPSPDRFLISCDGVVATADSAVLDRCQHWYNLARRIVEEAVAEAWIVDPTASPERGGGGAQ